MPFLIILGIVSVWGAVSICESSGKNTKPHSSSDLDNMLREMIGKSEREARKILKKYGR